MPQAVASSAVNRSRKVNFAHGDRILLKSSSAVITRQSAILREGGGPTTENVEVSELFSGRCFRKLKANGEGVQNTYGLTLLLTGNEARERFHHALGFSVAMRFERFDDLYLADSTVLENDKTELDDTLHAVSYRLFGILEVLRYVSQQGRLTSGEKPASARGWCTLPGFFLPL